MSKKVNIAEFTEKNFADSRKTYYFANTTYY